MKKIIDYIKSMFNGRSGKPNTKIICGVIGFFILAVGLFIGVDEKLYYIFAMCDVFYFGGSVIDNWTAPKIDISKTETTEKKSNTTIDVAETIKQVKKKK